MPLWIEHPLSFLPFFVRTSAVAPSLSKEIPSALRMENLTDWGTSCSLVFAWRKGGKFFRLFYSFLRNCTSQTRSTLEITEGGAFCENCQESTQQDAVFRSPFARSFSDYCITRRSCVLRRVGPSIVAIEWKEALHCTD